MRWRLAEGPYFDNQVATLRLDGREATIQLDKTIAGDEEERELDCVVERRLAREPSAMPVRASARQRHGLEAG